jgi:CRISPR-associated protein Cmr6
MLGEYKAITRKATVKGRMIVGLGDESVLETSIALHHTYGVPYIPGSALKGLASSYAHQKLGENWQKGSDAHNILFGNTDKAGYITFFDALYVPDSGHHGQALYPDIITVHHQEYYNTGKDNAPADWDSPTPVPFLSATGSYLLALAAPDLPTDNEWVPRTFDILEHALKEMGIGAKTSSGYGRMEFEIDQNGPGMEEAQAFIQELGGIQAASLTSRFDGLVGKCNRLPSKEAKAIAAKALIDKIRSDGKESEISRRPLYRVLQSFVSS